MKIKTLEYKFQCGCRLTVTPKGGGEASAATHICQSREAHDLGKMFDACNLFHAMSHYNTTFKDR